MCVGVFVCMSAYNVCNNFSMTELHIIRNVYIYEEI